MTKCTICGTLTNTVIYDGPIRTGKFGDLSSTPYPVYRCSSCEAVFLPDAIDDIRQYYESEEYRKTVNGETSEKEYYRLHDGQQIDNLAIAGTDLFRDKTVADIGSGAGAFLDMVRGSAKNVFGIEPSSIFQQVLKAKNIRSYPYCKDASNDLKGAIDVCVTFSVLEHISDPLTFLKEILGLLSPGGRLILSTPNAEDILITFLGDVYKQFFYRKAHVWYFSSTALKNLLLLAGFKNIRIVPFHRFGLANFLTWTKEKAPKGNKSLDFVNPLMDAVWKKELERQFICDYLYAIAN